MPKVTAAAGAAALGRMPPLELQRLRNQTAGLEQQLSEDQWQLGHGSNEASMPGGLSGRGGGGLMVPGGRPGRRSSMYPGGGGGGGGPPGSLVPPSAAVNSRRHSSRSGDIGYFNFVMKPGPNVRVSKHMRVVP